MSNFLNELNLFIEQVENMPRFSGQTQALRALKRIRTLSAFKGA